MNSSMPKKNTTILVKKADGTKVRVSLAEFLKMKESGEVGSGKREVGSGAENKERVAEKIPVEKNIEIKESIQSPKPVKKVEVKKPVSNKSELDKIVAAADAQSHISPEVLKQINTTIPENTEDDIVRATPHELSTTTPVTHIFKDEAQATEEWDHTSLLEEDMDEIDAFKKQGSQHVTHDMIAQNIIIPKHVDDNVSTRLTSLVASWQKGIRQDEQFVDMATRAVQDGGVGMKKNAAEKMLKDLQKNKQAGIGFAKNNPIPKKQVNPQIVEEKISTSPYTAVVQTHRVHPPKPTSPVQQTPPAKGIQDISTPQMAHQAVGPQQEAGAFTLIDFRRLSRDPVTASDMLVGKFMSWKDESFLLYMNARQSWLLSPLYQQYVTITTEALNTGKSVAELLQGKSPEEFLTFEEYQQVIAVDSQLRV